MTQGRSSPPWWDRYARLWYGFELLCGFSSRHGAHMRKLFNLLILWPIILCGTAHGGPAGISACRSSDCQTVVAPSILVQAPTATVRVQIQVVAPQRGCTVPVAPEMACSHLVSPERRFEQPVSPERMCSTIVAPQRGFGQPIAPNRSCTRYVADR